MLNINDLSLILSLNLFGLTDNMIYDMTPVILSLAKTYQRVIYESFEFQGVTYVEPVATIHIQGVLSPLTSEDRLELLGFGYTIEGKVNFYLPISQGRLAVNDVIIDENGVEWVVVPHDADYSGNGGYIKYRLARKSL